MRIWFSGPRILGGLVRPGVSFGPEDMRRASAAPSEPNAAERVAFRLAALAIILYALVLALFAAGVIAALMA
jgi:hypothetical protein